MGAPVVYQYQQALDEFRRAGEASPLLKRMSELISLLDLTTTLNSALSREEILDAALLVVLGELQSRRGALFVRGSSGTYERRASRGVPSDAPAQVMIEVAAPDQVLVRGEEGWPPQMDGFGLEVLCPIVRFARSESGRPSLIADASRPLGRYDPGPVASPAAGPADGGRGTARVIALLGLGGRADGRPYRPEDRSFLQSVAACAATPIENGLIYHELRDLNQRLSVKVFQLHNLFDISRELVSTFDEEAIKNLVTTTVMGHLLVSRCALFLRVPGGLAVAHERGLRGTEGEALIIPDAEAEPILAALQGPRSLAELPNGPLKDRLARARMAMVVPLAMGDRVHGLLAVGERPLGQPFTEEDREFAQMLARQALAALETVRLHRDSVEKQRRDREMQIAREIQKSLFPPCCPTVPGYQLAAQSRSCFEVGGDHYDFIPLPGERWAIAVADVSGKGAPASIMMASVHAWLRALAGTAPPAVLVERLDRFLLESTQPSRYVTLFYAELDPARRLLSYVNAGHVPPFHLSRQGACARLGAGGPVLGLIEGARFEAGEAALEPGDLVAMVTDGVTEALSPGDVEFGDGRLLRALRGLRPGSAEAAVDGIVDATFDWTGEAGCSDDVTLLFLKVLET